MLLLSYKGSKQVCVLAVLKTLSSIFGTHLPLPRNGVFNHSQNVVVWTDGPALLVGGVGDVELAILPVIGVECQA